MVRKELSETEIAESIPDLWQPLTQEQREFLAQNFTIQKYKKNETIYCEGETPMHLMCLLSGKVKIYKEGVGGRSQIIRVLKTKEYFAYRAFFAEGNFVTAASAFDENVSSADKPLLVLDNSKKAWKHHSCGTFTNQNKRTAFEFKEDDGSTVIADIKKVDARFVSLLRWLGENHIPVRLSGENREGGYMVYRIRETAFGGGTKLSAEDGFLQFMISLVESFPLGR